MKEIELAKIVVAFLHEREWEAYQEVHIEGKTCDIVALNSSLSWAIECKKSNLFAVMAQAREWLGRASLVSIAMPWVHKSSAEHRLAHEICRALGIGLLAIRDEAAHELFRARLYRRIQIHNVTAYLMEGQKTFLPAGSKGGYYSPFKQTCDSLRWYVRSHPGCSMKEAMTNIDHHYSSEIAARGSMLQWLHLGKVSGIEMQRERKRIYLYPKEASYEKIT